MNVLIQFCFIHVVGGYVNVAQISSITYNSIAKSTDVSIVAEELVHPTGDKTPEDFLDRVKKTCGGRHE